MSRRYTDPIYPEKKRLRPWQQRVHEVIFEADTPVGKAFDGVLIVCILLSVVAVMVDSVGSIHAVYSDELYAIEWFFTLLFLAEYLLRLLSVGRPLWYATSFFGVVDLLAILPTFISLFVPGSQYLLVIRLLRMLRIFRVLKLVQYMREARLLMRAMRASVRKISVFLLVLMILVTVFGSLMYLIEGGDSGFTSIPKSIYWAIVTLTTVGYGDISPQTNLGQLFASIVMVSGYAIIAVPTGIVTVELSHAYRSRTNTQSCFHCTAEGHDDDAHFCRICGAELNPEPLSPKEENS